MGAHTTRYPRAGAAMQIGFRGSGDNRRLGTIETRDRASSERCGNHCGLWRNVVIGQQRLRGLG